MQEMPRRRIRLEASIYRAHGQVVSITTCVADRLPVFEDLDFGHLCIEELRELSNQTGVKVLGFCLMPDHAHLLLGTGEGASVVGFMRAWKSRCYHLRRAGVTRNTCGKGASTTMC